MSRTKRTDKRLYCAIAYEKRKDKVLFRCYRALTLLDVRDYMREQGYIVLTLSTKEIFDDKLCKFHNDFNSRKKVVDSMTLYNGYKADIAYIMYSIVKEDSLTLESYYSLAIDNPEEVWI